MQFLSSDTPEKTAIKLGEIHIKFDQLQDKIQSTAEHLKKDNQINIF